MNLFGLTTRMVYLGLLSGAPVVAPASAPNRLCTPLCWVAGKFRPNRSALGSVNQMEAQSGDGDPAGPAVSRGPVDGDFAGGRVEAGDPVSSVNHRFPSARRRCFQDRRPQRAGVQRDRPRGGDAGDLVGGVLGEPHRFVGTFCDTEGAGLVPGMGRANLWTRAPEVP